MCIGKNLCVATTCETTGYSGINGPMTMPRYFFDVHDGTFARDDEGVELASADAARKQIWKTLPRWPLNVRPMAKWPFSYGWTFATRVANSYSTRRLPS